MVPGFGVSAECQSIGTIGKKQRAVARSIGLVIQPQKLSVGDYFELSFLGCGLLINLSNMYDSTRFRALWKKIRQKYDIQQEPSLFKGHPLSCQYRDALCSMIQLKNVYEIMDCAKNQIFPSCVCADQGMVPGFGVSAECQSIGTSGKKQRASYLAPKTLSWCIF